MLSSYIGPSGIGLSALVYRRWGHASLAILCAAVSVSAQQARREPARPPAGADSLQPLVTLRVSLLRSLHGQGLGRRATTTRHGGRPHGRARIRRIMPKPGCAFVGRRHQVAVQDSAVTPGHNLSRSRVIDSVSYPLGSSFKLQLPGCRIRANVGPNHAVALMKARRIRLRVGSSLGEALRERIDCLKRFCPSGRKLGRHSRSCEAVPVPSH